MEIELATQPLRRRRVRSVQEKALCVIESVYDEFCNDLECQIAFHPENVPDALKTAHGKLAKCFELAHWLVSDCCKHPERVEREYKRIPKEWRR